jgi:hypothetical protein
VTVTLPRLPLVFGAPAKCAPRALWDDRARVLRWSLASIRPGLEACPRVVFRTEPGMFAELYAFVTTKLQLDVEFEAGAPGAGGNNSSGQNGQSSTLTGMAVEVGGGSGILPVETAAVGRLVVRPSFLEGPAGL